MPTSIGMDRPMMIRKIMSAGIDAIAHLTMKTIIEPRGILMSVTVTSLGPSEDLGSSGISISIVTGAIP